MNPDCFGGLGKRFLCAGFSDSLVMTIGESKSLLKIGNFQGELMITESSSARLLSEMLSSWGTARLSEMNSQRLRKGVDGTCHHPRTMPRNAEHTIHAIGQSN